MRILLFAVAIAVGLPTACAEEPVDPDLLRKARKLINGTLSADNAEQTEAWKELKEMGNLATPGLVALYRQKETSIEMTRNILLALGDSKDPRAGPALMEILTSPHAAIRKEAARALGESGFKEGAAALKNLFENGKESEDVRLVAAVAGAKLGSEAAYAVLVELLKSTRPEVRSRAVFALGKFGGESQVKAVLPALKDTESAVREDAIEALRLAKSPASYGPLVDATADEDFKVRSAAMEVLRELTGEKIENNPGLWRDWWAKQKK